MLCLLGYGHWRLGETNEPDLVSSFVVNPAIRSGWPDTACARGALGVGVTHGTPGVRRVC